MSIWRTAKEAARYATTIGRISFNFARARIFEKQRDYPAAIASLSEGLRLYAELWGSHDVTYRKKLLHLGFYHRRHGDVATAKQIYQQVVTLSQEAAEPNDETLKGPKLLVHREMWLIGLEEETTLSLRDIKFLIARCQAELEEWEPAKEILLDLVEHSRAIQPQTDESTLGDLLSIIAAIYHGAGEYEKAEQHYLESLRLLRQSPEYSRADEAWLYRELAVLAISEADKEKYAQAENYLKQALTLLAQSTRQDAKARSTVWQALVSLFLRQGEWDKADETVKQSVEDIRALAGENELVLAEHLNVLARQQEIIGRYASALRFLLQESDIVRRQCGPTDLRLARTLGKLGDAYAILHRTRQAQTSYEESLTICAANGEVASSLKAEIERSLAVLHFRAGGGSEKDLMIESADEAGIEGLISRYGNYIPAGRHQEVEDILRQALGLAEKTSDPKKRRDILTFVGAAQQRLGKHEEAEATYLHALELYDDELAEDWQDISLIYGNLANLYAESGQLAKADAMLRRSAKLFQYLAQEHPDAFVKELNAISSLYAVIGDSVQAGLYLEQALECLREHDLQESPIYGQLLTHMSMLKLKAGEILAGEMLAAEAMIILGRSHRHNPEYAMVCIAMGIARSAVGDLASAERAFENASQILKETLGSSHPQTRLNEGFLAGIYIGQGRYEEAEKLYVNIFAASDDEDENLPLLLSDDVLPRVLCLVALDRKNEALKWLLRLVAHDDRFIDNAFAFSTEQQRMRVLFSSQVGVHALLALTRDAFSHDLRISQQVLSVVLRRKALGIEALATQREAVMSGRYPHLASLLRELSTLQQRMAHMLWERALGDPQTVAQHIEATERRRSEIEAELARQIPEIRLSERLKSATCEEVANALPTNSVLIEFARQQGFAVSGVPDLQLFHDAHYLAFVLPAREPSGIKLYNLGEAEEIDQLIHAFQRLLTTEANSPTADAAAEAVSPDDSSKTETAPPLDESKSEQSHPRHFYASPTAQDSSREKALDELGQRLCAKLVQPWLRELGDYQQIFISPDGELHRLSFEVLPLESEAFLLDRYLIVYLGSGRDLLRYQSKPTPVDMSEPRLLVAAAPDFDLKSVEDEQPDSQPSSDEERAALEMNIKSPRRFRPLRWARQEGEAVARRLGTTALVGAEVSEWRIKKLLGEAPSPKILHLATHGFFLPLQSGEATTESPRNLFESGSILLKQKIGNFTQGRVEHIEWSTSNPLLRSCLALAGANEKITRGTDDGFLTALDIAGFSLSQTELVVLSACQTGVGDIQNGEGVWGLRRAFELAGAQTLVVSLWEVDDRGTQELMEVFYDELLKGNTRAQALREAKLWLRRRPGRTSHPFYWGAFICQGNYEAISELTQPTA